MSMLGSFGGHTSKYKRERGKALRAIVSDIYSPPRVSAVDKCCPSFGSLLGFALDLTAHDHDHCACRTLLSMWSEGALDAVGVVVVDGALLVLRLVIGGVVVLGGGMMHWLVDDEGGMVGGLGLVAFIYTVRSNQYDDPEGDARRILSDEWDYKPKP